MSLTFCYPAKFVTLAHTTNICTGQLWLLNLQWEKQKIFDENKLSQVIDDKNGVWPRKKQPLDNLYSGVPNTNTNLYKVDDLFISSLIAKNISSKDYQSQYSPTYEYIKKMSNFFERDTQNSPKLYLIVARANRLGNQRERTNSVQANQ